MMWYASSHFPISCYHFLHIDGVKGALKVSRIKYYLYIYLSIFTQFQFDSGRATKSNTTQRLAVVAAGTLDSRCGSPSSIPGSWVLEVTGVELELPGGYYWKANPELQAWLHEWIPRFAALLESGRLKPHPVQVNRGGLAKVINGMGALQRKEFST